MMGLREIPSSSSFMMGPFLAVKLMREALVRRWAHPKLKYTIDLVAQFYHLRLLFNLSHYRDLP